MQIVLRIDKSAEGKYHLAQSDLKMNFGINKKKGGGVFGEQFVVLNNFVLNKSRSEQTDIEMVNIHTDGTALAMPPKIELKMMKGMALSMTKMMLGGKFEDVLETVKANCKHLPEIFD
jgi:hypothetical protein